MHVFAIGDNKIVLSVKSGWIGKLGIWGLEFGGERIWVGLSTYDLARKSDGPDR
jgi:hypothetical protein